MRPRILELRTKLLLLMVLLSWVVPTIGLGATLEGNIFWDTNQNNIKDSWEMPPPFDGVITIKLIKDDIFPPSEREYLIDFSAGNLSPQKGKYSFDNLTSGHYTGIIINISSQWKPFPSNIPIYDVTISSSSPNKVNFGFVPIGISNEVPEIKLKPNCLPEIQFKVDESKEIACARIKNPGDNWYLVKWNFGDGSEEEVYYWKKDQNPPNPDIWLHVEHTYQEYGTGSYPIELTVYNHYGNFASETIPTDIRIAPTVKLMTISGEDKSGGSLAVWPGQPLNIIGFFDNLDKDKDGTTEYNYSWELKQGGNILFPSVGWETLTETGEIPLPNDLVFFSYPNETYTLTLTVKEKPSNFKASTNLTIEAMGNNTDPCAPGVATISSQQSGAWDWPNTWDQGRVPNINDWIRIRAGHNVVLPDFMVHYMGGLCIEEGATLMTPFGMRASTFVDIYATRIHNEGTIQGNPSRWGKGVDISLTAFTIENSGLIEGGATGSGLIGEYWYWKHHGGSVRVNAIGGHIKNDGTIAGGDANMIIVVGKVHNVGATGGTVQVYAADMQNSESKGDILTGCSAIVSNPMKVLPPPTVYVNISNIEGRIGTKEECSHIYTITWEPTTLTVTKDTKFENSEEIVIFGGAGDWAIDLSDLSEGAMTAEKTITLAVGEGSKIILPETQGKVFEAGEKLEIFADHFELNGLPLDVQSAKAAFEAIANTPQVIINPSKILYHVDVFHADYLVGEPGETIPVKVKFSNGGPTTDTYDISVTNSAGWELNAESFTMTINSMRHGVIEFKLKLPETYGAETVVTVTATSQHDPSVQAVADIYVNVKDEEIITPRTDSDNPADLTLVIDNTTVMSGEIISIINALSTFLTDNPDTQQMPTIELITFTDSVLSRVVTQDLAEVIARLQAMTLSETEDCPNASTAALESALPHMNPQGQVILVTSAPPHQDPASVITQAQQQSVKVNVLLAGTCGNEAEDKTLYQNLAQQTNGVFKWLPKGETPAEEIENALLEILTEIIPEPKPDDPKLLVGLAKDSFQVSTKLDDRGDKELLFTWDITERDNATMNIWCARVEGNELQDITRLNKKEIPTKTGGSTNELVTYLKSYPLKGSGLEYGSNYFCALEDISDFGICTIHCDSITAINSLNKTDLQAAQSACEALVATQLKKFGKTGSCLTN